MTPEDEAIQAIEVLIDDMYKEMLGWVPSWLGKRVLSPSKKRTIAKRIINISQIYVEEKTKSQP